MTAVSREPCAVCRRELQLEARRGISMSEGARLRQWPSWAIIVVKWVNHTKSDNRQSSLSLSVSLSLHTLQLFAVFCFIFILCSAEAWPQGRCITVDPTVSEPELDITELYFCHNDAVNEFSLGLICYNLSIITTFNWANLKVKFKIEEKNKRNIP